MNPLNDQFDATVLRPVTVCRDGFQVFVQASARHYCRPRVTGLAVYSHYEVSYPSQYEPLIEPWMERVHMPFDEGDNDPMKSVYHEVPHYVVIDMLDKHGGIDVRATVGAEESRGQRLLTNSREADRGSHVRYRAGVDPALHLMQVS